MPEYFTLAELRALPDMDDSTRYVDARCEAASAWIVSTIERECNTSFIVRATVDTLDGDGGEEIVLRKPFVVSVTSITVGGVALSAPELTALSFRNSVLRRPVGYSWTYGRANIVVTYSAGYSATPPADIKEAALQGTRYRLLSVDGKSGISDRSTSITNEFGNVQLSTANADGRPTGLPEVDAAIMGWANKLNVFGFA